MNDLIDPDIEGIYETQMTLEFRAIMTLGCVCRVDKNEKNNLRENTDVFNLEQLNFLTYASQPYLKDVCYFISYLRS